MQLFPERNDRRSRWLLPAALVLSLAVHLAGGVVARWWWPRIAAVATALLPRPTPTPEIVALSDAITIERRTVPRASRRAPQSRAARARPRSVAQLQQRAIPVPTLAPLERTVPAATPPVEATAPPTSPPQPRHRPKAAPPAGDREATAPPTSVPTAPPAKGAFSPQQLAALDAQFSRTIAQAQRALTDVPPQRRPPARNPNQLRYEAVMAGTPEQFFAAFQGDCVPLQGPMALGGGVRAYYIRCMIRYNDGYFENVSFPWIYRFAARGDPFDPRVNPNGELRFPPQGPPAGFVLPPHFALSRAVCAFYRGECAGIIARERANGGAPAADGP